MEVGRILPTEAEVTYFTCLKMLSETLAKMPIKYYQRTDKGIIEAEQTDTSRLLTKRPNPFMTPTVFWNTVEINRNHYGKGSFYERSIDNLYEVSVDESNLVAEDTDAATAIKDWFSKVQEAPDAAA